MAAGTIVVVPNHLPHLNFLNEWTELRQHQIIVVQDTDTVPDVPEGFDVTVVTHQDIADDLGDKAWIIPKRTSACRSYGFYKAWQAGADRILTLDNDCYPERLALLAWRAPHGPFSGNGYWVGSHLQNLGTNTTLDWVSGCDEIEFTRGFPYRIRNKASVVLSHGLWSNVPDLDAATSLHNPDLRLDAATTTRVLPRWSFFPMCGMNLAWRADLTPALYFGLFGPEYGFDQYDDIWAGVLCKKVLDHLGYAAMTGAPSVEHRKQSDVYANMKKQAPGLEMNENFWGAVQEVDLAGAATVLDAYTALIAGLPDVIEGEPEGWTRKFKEAALLWAGLFS